MDVVYRLFLLEHLLGARRPPVMDPILDATARGEVAMFTPLDSELFASKAALAMLSGEASRDLFGTGRAGRLRPDTAVDPDGAARSGHPGGRPRSRT